MVSLYRFSFSDNPNNSNRALTLTAPPAQAAPRFAIEVEDNGDGRLDRNDRFTYINGANHYSLEGNSGSILLNYYLNPETLRRMQLSGNVQHREGALSLTSRPETLESTGIFDSTELYRIHRGESVWSLAGGVDTDVIEGRRTFRPDENAAWSRRFSETNPVRSFLATPGGIHISDYGFYTGDWGRFIFGDMSWSEMRIGQLAEKTIVGMTFGALSFASSANATWHTFSTNFTSNRLGRILLNRSAEERIAAFSRPGANAEENLQNNINTVVDRTEVARGNLYFGFTDPIIAVACAADMDFWRWVKQVPSPSFGAYSILGLYARNIAGTATALASGVSSSPAGLRVLGTSTAVATGTFTFFYEASQMWYSFYGHLPYHSTENRVFSAVSSILSSTWILARASTELRNITMTSTDPNRVVSGALNWANLARASRVLVENNRSFNIQFVELFRDFARNFPLANLITRRLIDPSLRELSINLRQAATSLQEANLSREKITAIMAGASARTWFMNALNSVNPRLLTGYLNRELASAGRAVLKAQQALVSAAESAESAGNLGRLGRFMQATASRLTPYNSNWLVSRVESFLVRNSVVRLGSALEPVQRAVQSARALLSASQASATRAVVQGAVETVGGEIAEVAGMASQAVRTGGIPQAIQAVEAGVEGVLETAAHAAGQAARAGAAEVAETVIGHGARALAPELLTAGAELTGLVEVGGAAALAEAGTGTALATTAATTAVAAETTATVAGAAESAIVAAEAITAGAAAEVGLVVAAGAAMGVGIGTGIAYGLGIYDKDYSPRDAWNDFRSMLFD